MIRIAFVMLTVLGCRGFAEEGAKAELRILLVGDSTVTDASGWGAGFKKLLNDRTQCVNYAQGGRSSKSFRDEGHWQKALTVKGDYVLIQFGHNDCPGKGPERETDPATTFPENLSRYIDEARQVGMKPILVTSLTRRHFSGGKIKSDLIPYAEAAKKVAAEKKVPLLDLHARSIEQLDKMGAEAAEIFNPVSNQKTPDGKPKPDRTHLSVKGAEMTAALIADELRKIEPELARIFK